MFSNLGPLFKTTFRQAESNDTRLHIPHEERDNRRRQDEEPKPDKETPTWDDDTSVSLVALKTFLINFLKTLPGGADVAQWREDANPSQPVPTRPPQRERPTSTHAARAVRAYQSMAEKTGGSMAPSVTPAEDGQDPRRNAREPTADLLKSQELRDIYGLIDALEQLEAQGVTLLHIKKADSFLDSLKNAVRALQSP